MKLFPYHPLETQKSDRQRAMPIKESIYLPCHDLYEHNEEKQENINEKAIKNDTAHKVNSDLLTRSSSLQISSKAIGSKMAASIFNE